MALVGLNIVIAGNLRESTTNTMKLIKSLGGNPSYMLSKTTTHLVTTEDEVRSDSFKVRRAVECGAIVVSEQWLQGCAKEGKRLDEKDYVLSSDTLAKKEYFEYETEYVAEVEANNVKQQEKEEAKPKPIATPTFSMPTSSSSSPPTSQPSAHSTASVVSTSSVGGYGEGFDASGYGYETKPEAQTVLEVDSASGGFKPTRKPLTKPSGPIKYSKPYKESDMGKPYFPKSFQIEYYNTLQWTDIKANHNKYYCIELHTAEESGRPYIRIYTHYGRTDDLAKKPDSGQKENRFYNTLPEAENAYCCLIEEKTITKGYRKVELVFSNIGSPKLRALLSAAPAPATTNEAAALHDFTSRRVLPETNLTQAVKDLVEYMYEEASKALNKSLGPAKITARGIETPLGVVGLAQIERGEAILQKLYEIFKLGDSSSANKTAVEDLTNEFYTIIPHNLGGRGRDQVAQAVINKISMFHEKSELLQLMKDMLQLANEGRGMNVSDIDMKYLALKSKIVHLEPNSEKFQEISSFVRNSQVGSDNVNIANIYTVHRDKEWEDFAKCSVTHNHRLLFHGSRISNYVGLVSRGVLMPKTVVEMGGKRRDAGLLGHGIYFGDSVTTSGQYTTPGDKGTRLMLLNNVALGNVKDYTKVMFGLTEPPHGFQSVHGVRATDSIESDFKDDEYVIFNSTQQHQEYLLEFSYRVEPEKPQAGAIGLNNPAAQAAKVKKEVEISALDESVPDSAASEQAYTFDLGPLTAAANNNSSAPSLTSATVPKKSFKFGVPSTVSTEKGKQSSFGLGSSSAFGSSSSVASPLKLQKTVLQTSMLQPTGLQSNLRLSGSGLSTTFQLKKSADAAMSATSSSLAQRKTFVLKKSATPSIHVPITGPVPEDDPKLVKKRKEDETDLEEPITAGATPSKKKKLRSSVGSNEGSSFLVANQLKLSSEGSVAAPTPTLRASSGSDSATPTLKTSGGSLRSSGSGFGAAGAFQAAAAAHSVAKQTALSLRTMLSSNLPISKLTTMIGRDNYKIKQKEDKLRELFAKERNSYSIADAYVLLIDAFKSKESWEIAAETPEEQQIPKILTKPGSARAVGAPAIVSAEQFQKNFTELTRGVFKGMDWKNTVVAGGAVLAALQHDMSDFKASDVDVFIYGLTEQQATNKLKDIFFTVQSNTNGACEMVRTQHAVTIIGQYPIRHVQVVLRLYKSPAEVLMGFDIDCCSVGYDGNTVWALPRAHRAITKRYNLVDMSRRSLTYETRLYKYAKRGFRVAVPGLQTQLVDTSIFEKKPWQVKGLAKLLLFEHIMLFKPRQKSEPWKPKAQRYQVYARDEFSEHRIDDFEAVEVPSHLDQDAEPEPIPDYSHLFLPWGPQWMLTRILKHLEHRDKAHYFSQLDAQPGVAPQHLLFVGINNILEGKSNWDKYSETMTPTSDPNAAGIAGPLAWITENPGRQLLTGSFHPIEDEEWYDEAYVSDSNSELLQQISDLAYADKPDAITNLFRKVKTIELNASDTLLGGLTPLSYACLFGKFDLVRTLLEKGASATHVDPYTGFSPIHFACFNGDSNIVELLLQKRAVTNAATRDQKWTPLHFCAYYDNQEALKILLGDSNNHPDVNAKDVRGRTPAFMAAMGDQLACLELLKASGADLTINDFSANTPLAFAAARGNKAVASYLIAQLKPNFPPVIVTKPIATPSQRRSGDVLEEPPYYNKDSFGQTLLHLAVRAGEVHLVRKLLHNNIKDPATVDSWLDHVAVDYEDAPSHFPVDQENAYGQTALQYCHILLSSLVKTNEVLKLEDDASNLLGLPTCSTKKNWSVIRNMLLAAGAQPVHLCYHRDLPKVSDDKLQTVLQQLAVAANDAYEAARVIEYGKRAEERRLAEEEMARRAEKKREKRQPTSFHASASSSSLSPTFNSGLVLDKSSSIKKRAFREKIEQPVLDSTPFVPEIQQLSLTAAPTFAAMGNSASIAVTSSNSACGDGSAAKLMAGKSDSGSLLVAIIHLFKAGALNVAEKGTLKTLALAKERHILAALKTFQYDNDWHEFADTLKKLSQLAASRA